VGGQQVITGTPFKIKQQLMVGLCSSSAFLGGLPCSFPVLPVKSMAKQKFMVGLCSLSAFMEGFLAVFLFYQ